MSGLIYSVKFQAKHNDYKISFASLPLYCNNKNNNNIQRYKYQRYKYSASTVVIESLSGR